MLRTASHTAGFTLVELLAGTTIFAIIMASLILMLNSFEATSDIHVTRQRMETIAAKAGDYYLSRENLPVPDATAVVTAPMGEVPLTAFHLDSKYRIDAWGRPMQYFSVRNDGDNGRPGLIRIDPLSAGAPTDSPEAMVVIRQVDLTATPPATGKTLITGVLVNGRQVAGVLISSGPDNEFQYNNDPPPSGDIYPVPFALEPGSDDIILPIDLTRQATRIAQTELKKLGEKVRAFDDRYIGKDNDGDNNEVPCRSDARSDPPCGYDENNCAPIAYPGPDILSFPIGDRQSLTDPDDSPSSPANTAVCTDFPQPGLSAKYVPGDGIDFDNKDYSCGVPTLDAMQENFCDTSLALGNCPLGYYVPNQLQYDYQYTRVDPIPVIPPDPPNSVQWTRTRVDCGYIGADYYRVPMDRGNPAPDDCHWGLVGDSSLDPEEVTNDQARAFIYCAYGLSPADIVDPWLNGYPWGSATKYPDDPDDPDPRFHKFFSAGPDKIVGTDDDIVAPL